MNRSLTDAIVRFIADPSPRNAEPLRNFRERHWRASWHWLITSGLALHLYHSLSEMKAEEFLPVAVRGRLSQLDHASALRTDELRSDLLKLVRTFQSANIPFVCWKGFALEPDFCSDIRLRPQMDFDFLVPAGEWNRIDVLLQPLGYQTTSVTSVERTFETHPGQHYSLEQVYCPKPNRKIELHLGHDHAAGGGPGADLAGCLQRRRIATMRGTEVPVLSAADAFLTHAAHAGRHALDGWVRLGWLLELDAFLRFHARDAALWRDIQRITATNRILAANAAVAVLLSSEVWGRNLDARLRWSANAIPSTAARWIQTYGRRLALADFPGTKFNLLLQRELLTDVNWRRLERRSLYGRRKVPYVAFPSAQSSFTGRIRALLTQLRFVLRRLRFHAVENVRYLAAKRTWIRFAGEGL